MWEDGFCRGRAAECLEEIDGDDPVRKAFSKMSIQLYNYGEGWVLGRCLFVCLFVCLAVWFVGLFYVLERIIRLLVLMFLFPDWID